LIFYETLAGVFVVPHLFCNINLLIFYETLAVFVVPHLFLYFVSALLTWYQEQGLIRLKSLVASAVESQKFGNIFGLVFDDRFSLHATIPVCFFFLGYDNFISWPTFDFNR